MTKSVYPAVLQAVLVAAEDFENNQLSLPAYQSIVFHAEQKIALIEEVALRDLLMNHENQIELIRFTTESPAEVHEAIRKLRLALKDWV